MSSSWFQRDGENQPQCDARSGTIIHKAIDREPNRRYASAVDCLEGRFWMLTTQKFAATDLGGELSFFVAQVPDTLLWDMEAFDTAWKLHPDNRPTIRIVGRRIQIPRWHQAYGEDYRFSGQVTQAQRIPDHFQPLLEWTQREIHPSLNGLLVNWYEGPEHYIGPHHDSTQNMVADAPIVTISFGENRKFRLSRGHKDNRVVQDFEAPNGTVFVLPQATNAVWKHAVPKSVKYTGQRISVTIRGFEMWNRQGGSVEPTETAKQQR